MTGIMAMSSTQVTSNNTIEKQFEEAMESGQLYKFIPALVLFVAWVTYLTFYNSRIVGAMITLILGSRLFASISKCLLGYDISKDYTIRIGSCSFSLMTCKLMLRQFALIHKDYSLHCYDCVVVYNYWKPFSPIVSVGHFGVDSKSERHLNVSLHGLEIHFYNRSQAYEELRRWFGPNPGMGRGEEDEDPEDEEASLTPTASAAAAWDWRALVPSIRVSLSNWRLSFGNYYLPAAWVITGYKGQVTYTTRSPSSRLDLFMHSLEFHLDTLESTLTPIPHNHAPYAKEDPPRNWGDGFRLFHCSRVHMLYRYDEPGLVPEHSLNAGDDEGPEWKLVIKTLKRCTFHYGPWADRQREYLWKFFFPPTYQRMEPTVLATPGERRQHTALVVEVHTVSDLALEVLFRQNNENRVLHVEASPGSYFETRVPWVVGESGYTTQVLGKLLKVEGTAAHICRNLLRCDILDFDVKIAYPPWFNQHQDWRLHFDTQDAQVTLVFDHKNFFKGLVEDWMRKARPDLLSFVPYTYNTTLTARRLHLITMANDYNWMASNNENAHISFFVNDFDMSLKLPYFDFLPDTVPVELSIKGYSVLCRLSLPETSTSREVVLSLASHLRLADRRGEVVDGTYLFERHTEKLPDGSDRVWVDCWSAPRVTLTLRYTYHPIPMVDAACERFRAGGSGVKSAGGTSGDAEAEALRTLRPEGLKCTHMDPLTFDPHYLDPDLIEVELHVPSSVVCLYGALLRHFLHVKENYFGSYQEPIAFGEKRKFRPSTEEADDPREYRPFAVRVNAQIHDVQGHLLKHCSPSSAPCPTLFLDCLGFEMDKRYRETKLQVLVGPVVAKVLDHFRGRPDEGRALAGGFLMMAGLQVRGHACFSHEGLPLDNETLEYAWNVDVTLGEIGGRLTSPQLSTVVQCLQMFVFLVKDSENELICSQDWKVCQHGHAQADCPKWEDEKGSPEPRVPCPTEDDLKYKFIRLSTDAVDIHFVEWGTSLQLCVQPIRLATCNLHGPNNREGITALIPHVRLTQYMFYKAPTAGQQGDAPSGLPVDSPRGEGASSPWLEAGSMSLGPISFSAGIALLLPEYRLWQDRFLRLHDKATKRLWFLWPDLGPGLPSRDLPRRCGCLGGCAFFGNNLSGRLLLADWERRRRAMRHGPPRGRRNDDDEETEDEDEDEEEDEKDREEEGEGREKRALLCVLPEGANDMGFGQSLLAKQRLVFELHEKDCCVESRSGMRIMRPPVGEERAAGSTRPLSDVIEDESISPGSDGSESSAPCFTAQHVSFALAAGSTEAAAAQAAGGRAYRTISLTSLISSNSETSRTDASVPSCSTPSDEAERSWVGGEQMVDLRPELENPISDSPLLMNAYRRHLTQFSCRRWALPMHVRKYFAGQSVHPLPRFSAFADGFSPRLMTERAGAPGGREAAERKRRRKKQRAPTSPNRDPSDNANSSSKESQFSSGDSAARTACTVRVQGSVNLLLTPLFLECMERYVIALTPEFSQMHACTVLDNLHCQCVQTAQYKRSQDSSEDAEPNTAESSAPEGSATPQIGTRNNSGATGTAAAAQGGASVTPGPTAAAVTSATASATMIATSNEAMTSEPQRGAVSGAGQTGPAGPTLPGTSRNDSVDASTTTPDVLCSPSTKSGLPKRSLGTTEETSGSGGRSSLERTNQRRCIRTQFTVDVQRINVCFLQLSTVEDVVTLESIMNSVKDLTCVSLLAFCLDHVSFQFLINRETNYLGAPPVEGNASPPSSSPEASPNEADAPTEGGGTGESREETIASVSVDRLHMQMRRLTRECNFTSGVQLTAVPPRHSKVLFAFDADLPRPARRGSAAAAVDKSHSRRPPPPMLGGDDTVPLLPPRSAPSAAPAEFQERSSGLIMFECGLEQLRLRCLRRRGYADFLEYFSAEGAPEAATSDEEAKKTRTSESRGTKKKKRPSRKKDGAGGGGGGGGGGGEAGTEEDDEDGAEEGGERAKKRTNSFLSKLDVSRVWLHFASPDRLPNKRRIDINRYDWNLLSTSTPAIKAWMRPSERLFQATKRLKDAADLRLLSVMACVMSEGLDSQPHLMGSKLRSGDFYLKYRTPSADALRGDPSCQIFTILRRYLDYEADVSGGRPRGAVLHEVESLLKHEALPQTVTLQRGILALTRQWRHFVYVPRFAAAPRLRCPGVDPLPAIPFSLAGEHQDAQGVPYESRPFLSRPTSRVWLESEWPVPQSAANLDPQLLSPNKNRLNSINDFAPAVASDGAPEAVAGGQVMEENPLLQLYLDEVVAGSDANFPLQNQHVSYAKIFNDNAVPVTEDLYQYVRSRQQSALPEGGGAPRDTASMRSGAVGGQESVVPRLNEAVHWEAQAAYVADAQVHFRPLLEAVGLHVRGIQRTTLMRKFGGYFSGQGMLDAFQVDIVQSEGNPLRRRRGGAHPVPMVGSEPCGAFLCQGFASRIIMRDVVNFAEGGRTTSGMNAGDAAGSPSSAVDIKPTTTHISCGFHINFVRQRVNISLLRLVHQFVTMVYSVHDQREELDRKRRLTESNFRRHRKQDSKGSSTGTESTGSTMKSYARLQSESSSGEEGAQLSAGMPGAGVPLAESKDVIPRCWRRLYHLLELYGRPTEMKTVKRKATAGAAAMPAIAEEEVVRGEGEAEEGRAGRAEPELSEDQLGRHSKVHKFTYGWIHGERIPIVIFATAKVKQMQMSAMLSGLNAEANVTSLHGSFSHLTKVKGRGNFQKKSIHQSVSAHIGESFAKLTEGEATNVTNVVQTTLAKSHFLISSIRKRTSERNLMSLGLGKVGVDLPHHPVRLHEMMQRSTQRLSHSLQEFIRATPAPAAPAPPAQPDFDSLAFVVPEPSAPVPVPKSPARDGEPQRTLIVRVTALAQGLRVTAAILPCLSAVYEIQPVTLTGTLGVRNHFSVSMPDHALSFKSTIALKDASFLPSVSIKLPRIFLEVTQRTSSGGSYWASDPSGGSRSRRTPPPPPPTKAPQEKLTRDLVVQEGIYLDAFATLSLFEQKLTTDLLNYLVVVVKAFMKEINEVIQKMAGEQSAGPTPPTFPTQAAAISESSESDSDVDFLPPGRGGTRQPQSASLGRHNAAGTGIQARSTKFTFRVAFAGIHLTATTPTNSSVKLETSEIQLELSNRVALPADQNAGASATAPGDRKYFLKVFVNAISVELGHLDKDFLYTERTPDFKTLAVFKTTIGLRNCLSEEMIPSEDANQEQEAFLIALTRPVLWMKPAAFDKAVLLWISYKNAYERWTDQMDVLLSQAGTPSSSGPFLLPTGVLLRHHRSTPQPAKPDQPLSTLFLQLTVEDLGICLPTGLIHVPSHAHEVESRSALVLTLESSRISACSQNSLVSKGEFSGFCFRFDDDFNLASDDWKPSPLGDPTVLSSPILSHHGAANPAAAAAVILNACVVPNGGFEVCSRTIARQGCNPKWLLDVQWLMRGLEVHLDVNIGRRLKVLFATVTSMAGYIPGDAEDAPPPESPGSSDQQGSASGTVSATGATSALEVLDPVTVERKFAELDSLIQSGAETSSLHDLDLYQYRLQRLQELEARLCSDVKRTVWQRLRKKSARASNFRDRFRKLPSRSPYPRSNSVADGAPGGPYTALHNARTPTSEEEEEDEERPVSTSPRSFSVIEQNFQTARPPREADEISLPSSPPSSGNVLEDEVWEGPAFSYPSPPAVTRRRGRPNALPLAAPGPPVYRLAGRNASFQEPPAAPPPPPELPEEPSVDLEFSVRLAIDSGKCVLHPRVEEEQKTYGRATGLRSAGVAEFEAFSPSDQRAAILSRYRAYLAQPSAKYSKITTFFLPAVNVKVNYNSRVEAEEEAARPQPAAKNSKCPKNSGPSASVPSRRKKADLYAACTLQTLPKEMVVSPALLDFLEQALETLPFISMQGKAPKAASSSDVTEPFPLTPVESFPVDVIVHINVQPSILRLTCLPVSPVQCCLKLPSVDLVFSTRRTQEAAELPMGAMSVQQQEEMFTEGGLCVTCRLSSFSLYIFHPYGNAMRSRSNTAGGDDWDSLGRSDSLSLDVEYVRLNIFRYRRAALLCPHVASPPEPGNGAKRQRRTGVTEPPRVAPDGSNLKLVNTVQISAVCDVGSSKFNYDTRRTTELVIFPKAWYRSNLARRLFLGEESNIRPDDAIAIPAMGGAATTAASSSPSHGSTDGFPPGTAPFASKPPSTLGHHRRSSSGDKHKVKERVLKDLAPRGHHRNLSASGVSRLLSGSPDTTHLPGHRSLRRRPSGGHYFAHSPPLVPPAPPPLPDVPPAPAVTPASLPPPSGATDSLGQGAWETLVLFCANLCDAQVEMYMGSAMGKTRLGLKGITCQGHLMLDSESRKDANGGVHVSACALTAEEGIVGGELALTNLNADLHVTENPAQIPEHAVSLTLGAIEGRVEYMSANILYGRVSNLSVRLFDEWTLRQPSVDPSRPVTDEPVACRRHLQVSVDGQVSWDQVHFLICRSTTVDLLKAYRKVAKFAADQLQEYERLADLEPRSSRSSARRTPTSTESDRDRASPSEPASSASAPPSASLVDQLLQRHWQAPMRRLMACSLRIPQPAGTEEAVDPCEAVIMGGHIELQGGGLALACFAGTFRAAKSWAVFALRRPLIDFSTEAQMVPSETPEAGSPVAEEGTQGKKLHVEQVLIFQLGDYYGNSGGQDATRSRSGTVSKLSRRQDKAVPHNSLLRQWFNYAFYSVENSLDQPIFQFPVIRRPSFGVSKFSGEATPTEKDAQFVHEREDMFHLPPMQLNLQTFHLQGLDQEDLSVILKEEEAAAAAEEGAAGEEAPAAAAAKEEAVGARAEVEERRVGKTKAKLTARPEVRCVFVTEFAGHVLISVNADILVFLQNLVKSYLSEKIQEDSRTPSLLADSATTGSPMVKDVRLYNCIKWQLNPTIRNMKAKELDYTLADVIVKKLGFSQRTTIPKWMQRGLMDNMDSLSALLVDKVIEIMEMEST